MWYILYISNGSVLFPLQDHSEANTKFTFILTFQFKIYVSLNSTQREIFYIYATTFSIWVTEDNAVAYLWQFKLVRADKLRLAPPALYADLGSPLPLYKWMEWMSRELNSCEYNADETLKCLIRQILFNTKNSFITQLQRIRLQI